MAINDLPLELTRLIAPRALRGYAEGLGWLKVDGVNGHISAYQSPVSENRQLIVPLDERLDDYAERTADAVRRLADFEHRPAREVLEHLLLPPCDVISFRVISPETEAGEVSLESGVRTIEGAKSGLLAVAHSVVVPQAYHPRLGRDDARRFLRQCRLSTDRGSFIVRVACLLEQPPNLPGLDREPFARQVTSLFLQTLAKLAQAQRSSDVEPLVNLQATPGMSANLCEALLTFRPDGDRSRVIVSGEWSRTRLPTNRLGRQEVILDQDAFELAEGLASTLRSQKEPSVGLFVGYVDELRGDPTPGDPRPSGDVRVTLLTKNEEIRAKVELRPEEYTIAAQAHLSNGPIAMLGTLHRLPRLNKIEDIKKFHLFQDLQSDGTP